MTIPAHLLNNPLANPPALPHSAHAYALIKVEHVVPAVEWAIKEMQDEIAAIKNNPALPTFENTSEALEFSGNDLDRIRAALDTLFDSQSSDELRDAKKVIEQLETKCRNEISMDDGLFARLDAVHKVQATLRLDNEQARLLNKQHREFLDAGVNLDPVKKLRRKDISERLTLLANEFNDNVTKSLEAYERYIDDPDLLEGVPQLSIDEYAQAAADKGQPGRWLLQLAPYPMEVMTHGKNRALREEISRAYNNVGCVAPHDNRPIIMEILKLRHELATIMGYSDFAEMTLSDRMVKNKQTVNDFLDHMLKVYKPAAEHHLDRVKQLALSEDGLTDMQKWDYPYYDRLLQERVCNIDLDDFKKYLNLEKVLDGLRVHMEKQFGIELRDKTSDYSTYDPDVKIYEVYKKGDGAFVGLFSTDYYVRPGAKNDGAWMQPVRSAGLHKGTYLPPIVSNDCNFRKPVPGAPTFISVEEYTTLYHEFGHALHGLISSATQPQPRYPSLGGINVKLDWVEAPSQLQENWSLQKEVLDTFAVHHDTQQPLPASMIQALKDSYYFDAGYSGLRQIGFSMYDMVCHTGDPARWASVEDIQKSVDPITDLLPAVAGSRLASFSHIFASEYEAGYYSYKWAEVLDKHMFSVVTKNGLYDPAGMQLLIDHVYGSGDRRDPMDCFMAVTGTAPDPDMLFRHEGLLPPLAPVAVPVPLPKPVP